MRSKVCNNCRFFVPTQAGADNGHCRRNPPAVIDVHVENEMPYFITGWPDVALDDWCGEFARHESATVHNPGPRSETERPKTTPMERRIESWDMDEDGTQVVLGLDCGHQKKVTLGPHNAEAVMHYGTDACVGQTVPCTECLNATQSRV